MTKYTTTKYCVKGNWKLIATLVPKCRVLTLFRRSSCLLVKLVSRVKYGPILSTTRFRKNVRIRNGQQLQLKSTEVEGKGDIY